MNSLRVGRDVSRRRFLVNSSLAPITAATSGFFLSNTAAPAKISSEKALSTSFRQSLFKKGELATLTDWAEQQYIGMPIGGIGCGTVYLGGDGKLWCWDIFNEPHEGVVPSRLPPDALINLRGARVRERDGANFVAPPRQQDSPWIFDQGFAVAIAQESSIARRRFSRDGFRNIHFTGHAPGATINYADADCPVETRLEALTPFIPLDADASSFPAAVFHFEIANTSRRVVNGAVEGWFENPVLRDHADRNDAPLVNRVFNGPNGVGVIGVAEIENALDIQSAPALTKERTHGSFALYAPDVRALALTNSFFQKALDEADNRPFSSHPWSPAICGLRVPFSLVPGETTSTSMIVAWHFPNLRLQTKTWSSDPKVFPIARGRRWYASRYSDAGAVATALAADQKKLVEATRTWRDVWYDSTLPTWVLERSFNSVNALQTNTAIRFDDGRFWSWEGVGCCPGTCTHVWHYAQSPARLFPSLERDLRERTDFGVALSDEGVIGSRAEYDKSFAIDGQAGAILRALREHQMSDDGEFLERLWPRIKKALNYLIDVDRRSGPPDGIPNGDQPNTYDASWFGRVPAFASLYIAALNAGATMADAVNDTTFAGYCNELAAQGASSIMQLFNREYGYFTQKIDPAHAETIGVGDGCHIDQVIGQWWAHQVGLGRIFDGDAIRAALSRIWDHNFCTDVGVYQSTIADPTNRGNPYALAGHKGVLACTWPHLPPTPSWLSYWQFAYFNTCFQGLEYQLAGHMIWESDAQPDLLQKGLAVMRAVHDRYKPSERNPYNEIECSDHYIRAMSSYSVFLALCGFEYDGPNRHIGFKPRLTKEDEFAAAFTAAKGWGAYRQWRNETKFSAEFKVHYGDVDIETVALRAPPDFQVGPVSASFGNIKTVQRGRDLDLKFPRPAKLRAGDSLIIEMRRSPF